MFIQFTVLSVPVEVKVLSLDQKVLLGSNTEQQQ